QEQSGDRDWRGQGAPGAHTAVDGSWRASLPPARPAGRPGRSCGKLCGDAGERQRETWRPASGRLALRLDQAALKQELRDLHGVERRTLAQVVGDDPQIEAVLDRRILADTADIGQVLAGRFI